MAEPTDVTLGELHRRFDILVTSLDRLTAKVEVMLDEHRRNSFELDALKRRLEGANTRMWALFVGAATTFAGTVLVNLFHVPR